MSFRQERWSYANPQLKEVICQLRFPVILTINERAPAAFQEAIRDAFPRYEARRQAPPPRIVGMGGPNARLEQPDPVTHHVFTSSTGIWKIVLTQESIALSTVRYNSWEDFAQRLDRPLAEFIRVYQPADFERVGLRYVNVLSRAALGLGDTPWRELITPAYLGVLSDPGVDEAAVNKCATETQLRYPDGSFLKLHTGPGRVKVSGKTDPEPRFILDIDCFAAGQRSGGLVPETLSQLHGHASDTFRGAITDAVHTAMGPI